MNLAYRPRRIRCVVEYAVRIYQVKRTVGERQVFSVALGKTSFQTRQLKTLVCCAHGSVRQVDRRVMGASPSEAFRLTAATTTDLEYSQATCVFKSYCRLQPPVHLIPMLVEAPIELSCSGYFVRKP